jgi:hypothetical protein
VPVPVALQEGDTSIPQWRLQPLVIRGGGGPVVQVLLSTGGNQGPTSGAVEVRKIAPEPSRPLSAAPSRRGIEAPPLSHQG